MSGIWSLSLNFKLIGYLNHVNHLSYIVDADNLAFIEYENTVAIYNLEVEERLDEARRRTNANAAATAEHEENVRLHELHVAEQDAARAALEKERDAQVKWLTANYETAMAEWRRKVKSVRKINSDTLAAEKLKQRETDLVADLEAFDSVPPETCPTPPRCGCWWWTTSASLA